MFCSPEMFERSYHAVGYLQTGFNIELNLRLSIHFTTVRVSLMKIIGRDSAPACPPPPPCVRNSCNVLYCLVFFCAVVCGIEFCSITLWRHTMHVIGYVFVKYSTILIAVLYCGPSKN